ncbi:MAG: carboxypeptidase regulatory-like domain-containing protein [Candidatus Magasanikbacteria bacterium]
MPVSDNKGFSLIEILVSIGIFLIFAVGIYSGIQFIFKVVYQSRLRIIETSILNEQIEIMRNIPYADVGIIGGSPSGVLERTSNMTRNGIDFVVTRTVRNIDDEYDGVIGGDPNDTSPADYKFVEIEVVCNTCGQNTPLTMTTHISPRYLEGDPTHGALFIEVFDAGASPVSGATVHVVSTETDPQIDMTDTTDNDGMLRIIDLPEGIGTYSISVTKNGYTSDQTMASTVENPNPVKASASVVAQDVTEISFSIDLVSTLQIETLSELCVPLSNVPLQILGTKLYGTDPDLLEVETDFTTNGSGQYTFNNMEWDAYAFRDSIYDVIGSIPIFPVNLYPNVNQEVQLILGANTAHSLLVNVVDSVTELPLSSASVRIFGNGIDETKFTGLGHVRQTDWSGGDGQETYADVSRYFLDNGQMETENPEGDLKLKEVGGVYTSDAVLESSTFDLGTAVNFEDFVWEPFLAPDEAGENAIRFQISTSSSPQAVWEYLGPDGTNGTYYDKNSYHIAEVHDGDQYMRYKVFLHTDDNAVTPVISDVDITYTTSCTPPGQTYFGSLVEGSYTIEVLRDGYVQKSESISVSGDMIFTIDLISE